MNGIHCQNRLVLPNSYNLRGHLPPRPSHPRLLRIQGQRVLGMRTPTVCIGEKHHRPPGHRPVPPGEDRRGLSRPGGGHDRLGHRRALPGGQKGTGGEFQAGRGRRGVHHRKRRRLPEGHEPLQLR